MAPAPTGSKTIGIPILFASFPAISIDSTVLAFKVPMFRTSAFARFTISFTSFSSSAITGDAPIARVILAQSFIVTLFVI